MKAPRPEFSRLVPLGRMARQALREAIEASEAEREALARRFDLVSLDRLSAVVELSRRDGGILLEVEFEAAFVQNCVVTLEPVAGRVADRFALRYAPAGAPPPLGSLDVAEDVWEPIEGDAIDIGEAVAQELSLCLPDFPRHPDAVIEDATEEEPGAAPFAALERLRDRGSG